MWFKQAQRLVWFTEQFRLLYNAGLGFVASLKILAESTRDKELLSQIKGVLRSLEQGQSFSQSLAKYPKHFEHFYVEMIRIGEETGRLSEVLIELEHWYRRKIKFQQDLLGALSYPIIVMVLMLIITTGLCVMVIPRFEAVFLSFHAPLPFMTRVLFGIVNFAMAHFIILGTGLVVLGFMAKKYGLMLMKLSNFKQYCFNWPLLGPFYHKLLLLRLCQVLGMALRSGLSMQDSLKLLQNMVKDTPFYSVSLLLTYELKQGRSLSQIFAKPQYFPGVFQGFLRVAEETGKLDHQFLALASIFEEQVRVSLEHFKTLLEPCMMLLTGIMVGGVVLAIYYPIFSLGSVV